MKFTAAGDCIIQRRVPKDYDGFREVREMIELGDAIFELGEDEGIKTSVDFQKCLNPTA